MTNVLDAALRYVARGWPVVHIAYRKKRPSGGDAWQEKALRDAEAVRAAFNGHDCNVGVLLGTGGLCDVDLDCAEALAVGGFFLPSTGMIFGRKSSRYAHYIYTSNAGTILGKAVQNYDDPDPPREPDGKAGKARLLELRVGGEGKVAQTVFPGSIHMETGEPIAFEPDGDKEPAAVDGAELIGACGRVAAAALVARAWPAEGGHKPAQVLGGFLARAGFDLPNVALFAQAVLFHVDGPNAKQHVRTARDAAEAFEHGRNAYGLPELKAWIGEKRAKAVAGWLDYSEATKAGASRKSKRAKPQAKGEEDAHGSLIAELAALPPLKYARQRKVAANTIGIPVGMLDKLVTAERKAEDASEGHPAHWDVEPWPEAVVGAALLGSVADTFSRYAVLPQHAPDALALWVAHAWALDCFQCSPFATLVSPTKRCGKTRVLAILKWLAPRSELVGSISAAALFRYIQQERPTLLMDEADRTVAENEELQGILNASHKKVGAYVIRCEGDDNRPRRFSTWAPKAIATISKLADTLRDRSIVIEMRRKTAEEEIERWNEDDTEELAVLRRKLLRWTEDQAEALKCAFPDAPPGLDDRAADNWHPLLAVADAAGGNWPERARIAAVALSGGREEDDALPRLLSDIRAIFAEMPHADWIGSTPLAERLAKLDGSPWQEWKRGKPITPTGMARLLKRTSIHPSRNSGTGGRYLKEAFEDAWTRYLPREA